MTMIACTLNHGVPIIIGDILFSDTTRKEAFVLPTLSDNVMDYLSASSNLHPYEFNQKIYVLKWNVCIALAGRFHFMKMFLEDIRIYCNSIPDIKAEHIVEFLQGYNLNDPHEYLSFLIMTIEKLNDQFKVGHFKRGIWQHTESDVFGEVFASGSGATDFLEAIKSDVSVMSNFKQGSPDYAIQTNVIMLSSLLAKERATLQTVRKYWGAGFEMIFFNGKTFAKFDTITFIINQGKFDNQGDFDIPIPGIVLHYRYDGDVLLITVIASIKGETEIRDKEIIIRYHDFHVNLFIIKPIDFLTDIDVDRYKQNTSFTSFRNAMGYIIESSTGKYLPASFHEGLNLKVEYEHLHSLTITMQKELNDILAKAAKEAFPNL